MHFTEIFNANFLGRWFVLHTKSRQEKRLSEDLLARGIAHFLPLVPAARYYGRRKAIIAEPLFPGYVFMRGAVESAYEADRTGRLANILPVADQAKLTWELENLAMALSREVPLDAYPSLKEGVKVEVKAGPLKGLQGWVEARKAWNRLILEVKMLGRAVSLDVESSLLVPV